MKNLSRALVSTMLILAVAGAIWAQAAQGGGKPPTAPVRPRPLSTAAAAAKVPVAPRLDINAATSEQLVKALNITPAVAAKIIKARPYRSKADLKTRGVMTPTEFVKVASKIVVKSAKK